MFITTIQRSGSIDANMSFTVYELCSGVSRVWQVGHVPWAPLVGGATEVLAPNVPIWERPKQIFLIIFLKF